MIGMRGLGRVRRLDLRVLHDIFDVYLYAGCSTGTLDQNYPLFYPRLIPDWPFARNIYTLLIHTTSVSKYLRMIGSCIILSGYSLFSTYV